MKLNIDVIRETVKSTYFPSPIDWPKEFGIFASTNRLDAPSPAP